MTQNKNSIWAALAIFAAAVSPAALAVSVNTIATADAFVATGPTGNLSGNNYGNGGAMALAAAALPEGEFQSLLRFGLADVQNSLDSQFGHGLWTIQSVALQLTASPHNNLIYNEVAAGQFSASLMQNTSWIEGSGTAGSPTTDGVSFNSLQGVYLSANDQGLGSFSFGGGTSGANSYDLDLAPGLISAIQNGGDVSLRLYAADNLVSYLFSSRGNASSANRPTLIINAVPEPASLALFLAGMVALFSFRSSKKSR